MSKHLWLYEGVTEYSSVHMQVMYGLLTPDEFLNVINQKLDESSYYSDDLPFTEMSLGALDDYEDEYENVYEKGALIGMCLDLILLELSDGQMGIRELLKKLSETYGVDRSFSDQNLLMKLQI
jgi:predicted metalloprotease with PDZ domain